MKHQSKIKRLILSCWSFLCFFQIGGEATAAPGDLDQAFAGTGRIQTVVGGGSDAGNAVARQPDGKLVVAGTSENGAISNFSLARYNPDGTLDAGFGSGGKVLVNLISGGANALTIQADGKIVAAGYGIVSGTNEAFTVVRFNQNGTLDTSFNVNGIVQTDFTGFSDRANAVGVRPDGKIVAAGFSVDEFSRFNFALARYNSNGVPDTSFDTDGKLTSISGIINAVGIAGNKIVVAGSSASLARYNADGTLDSSFDADGIIILDTDNENGSRSTAYSLVFAPNDAGEADKIIVTGEIFFPGTMFVAPSRTKIRLWSRDITSGAADATFGAGGRVTLEGSSSFESTGSGRSIQIQFSAGFFTRIVVGGRNGGGSLVARFLRNGALDTGFGGGDGIEYGGLGGEGSQMIVQPSDNGIVLAGTLLSDFGIVRFNSEGALDATFSSDGRRRDDVGNKIPVVARSAIVQPDGKIVVAGDVAVTRFNADGSFDQTFDEDGKAQALAGAVKSAAIQPDGKIVAASSFVRITNTPPYTEPDTSVYRFNHDGSPDSSFDADGTVSLTFGSSGRFDANVPNAVGVQSDGKIIVAGTILTGSNTSSRDFAVARLLPNGAIDTNFGTNGIVVTPVGAGEDLGSAMKIQTDDKIIVAGTANNDFAVVRYNPDGSLDSSFSFDGKVITPIGADADVANALAIYSGKIVVAGSSHNGSNNDFAVARYNADGSLDASFDADGKTITAVRFGEDSGNAVAVQTNGKILVAGTANNFGNNDFAAVRYNINGSLDDSYGTGGKVVLSTISNDAANAIALDSAGRAYLAGAADGLFGIVRLLGDFDPTAATVSVSGRVTTASGKGIRNIQVTLTDAGGTARTISTGAFGAYRFEGVPVGATYILSVSGKRFVFNNPAQIVSVNEQLDDLNFTGSES